MLIELLQEKDVLAASELNNDVVLEKTNKRVSIALTQAYFENMLVQGFMIGAFHNDDLVGIISARISEALQGNYEIGDLAVKGSFREQGIGSQLLQSTLDIADADKNNNGFAFLAVDSRNQDAIRLYKTFSFAVFPTDKPEVIMVRKTPDIGTALE